MARDRTPNSVFRSVTKTMIKTTLATSAVAAVAVLIIIIIIIVYSAC